MTDQNTEERTDLEQLADEIASKAYGLFINTKRSQGIPSAIIAEDEFREWLEERLRAASKDEEKP